MNTLARIADNYWLIRDDWANTIGIVIRLDDCYTAFLDGAKHQTLANLDAVLDYIHSDAEHHIDTRV